MQPPFVDRIHAGAVLADRLASYRGRPGALVLGLPRGGVVVAYEVATRLDLPLDVFLVRKLGVPGHEELAMGAIAIGGARVLNVDVIRSLGITEPRLEAVTAREQTELERRDRLYREGRPAPRVRGHTLILVDDGLATGASMRAAALALREQEPGRLVVAVPVGAPSTCAELGAIADEVVCAVTPEPFYGVGLWYEQFPQTTDDQVRALLAQAWARRSAGTRDQAA